MSKAHDVDTLNAIGNERYRQGVTVIIASMFFGPGSHGEEEAQTARFRRLCLALVVVTVAIGAGFYRQSAWATNLWPWPDVRMTYIFLASIAASFAAPVAWAAWRNEPGALDAVAFEFMIGAPAIGVYLLWLAVDWRDLDVALTSVGFLGLGAGAAVAFRRQRKVPIKDQRHLPTLFRSAVVVICIVLVVFGSALVFQRPDIFPWDISPQTSTVIGLIFLSAALLFGWVVVRPMWAYGEMALTAFLAYDIVLFVPYIDLLRNINDTATLPAYYGDQYNVTSTVTDHGINELNLAMYISVLAISAILAIALILWGAIEQRRAPIL